MNVFSVIYSGALTGIASMGTTFEQPMTYPQGQATMESCSSPESP
jgi:hypothetical protein